MTSSAFLRETQKSLVFEMPQLKSPVVKHTRWVWPTIYYVLDQTKKKIVRCDGFNRILCCSEKTVGVVVDEQAVQRKQQAMMEKLGSVWGKGH